MRNKIVKKVSSFLVCSSLGLQLVNVPILAVDNPADSTTSNVMSKQSPIEFKQGKSFALINNPDVGFETQVLFGDSDKEAQNNKDKKSVYINKEISADGKSIKWKVVFNKVGEKWNFGSLLSLVLPDGLKDPETIDRYVENQHRVGLKDRIDVKKHWDANITGRWKFEKHESNFNQEFDYMIGTSSGYNYHHLKTLKSENTFRKIFVDREWKSQKSYIWVFTTVVNEGYKAEDLFVGAGIRQGNYAFPRSAFVGPFDTDGDGTPDYIEVKEGTKPTEDDRAFPVLKIDQIYKGNSSFSFDMTHEADNTALPDIIEVKLYKDNADADTKPAVNNPEPSIFFDLQKDGTYKVRETEHAKGFELNSLGNNKWQVIVPKKDKFINGFNAQSDAVKDKVTIYPYFNVLKDVKGDNVEKTLKIGTGYFQNTIFSSLKVPEAVVKAFYDGQDSFTIIPVGDPDVINIVSDIKKEGVGTDAKNSEINIQKPEDDNTRYIISAYTTESSKKLAFENAELINNKDGSLTVKMKKDKFTRGKRVVVTQIKANPEKPEDNQGDRSKPKLSTALENNKPVIIAEPDGSQTPITLIKGETNKLAKITIKDTEDGVIKLKPNNFKHTDGFIYNIEDDGTVNVTISEDADISQPISSIIVGSNSSGSQKVTDSIGKEADEKEIKVNIVDKPIVSSDLAGEVDSEISKTSTELESLISNITELKKQDPKLKITLSDKQEEGITKDGDGFKLTVDGLKKQKVRLTLTFGDGKKYDVDVEVKATPKKDLPEPQAGTPRPINEGEKLKLENLNSSEWVKNIDEILKNGGNVIVSDVQTDNEQVKQESGVWTVSPKEGSIEPITINLEVKYANGISKKFAVKLNINQAPVITFTPNKPNEEGTSEKPVQIVASAIETEVGTLDVEDKDALEDEKIAIETTNVDGTKFSSIASSNDQLTFSYDNVNKKLKLTAAKDLKAGTYTITVGDKDKNQGLHDSNGAFANKKEIIVKVIDQETSNLNAKKAEATKEVDDIVKDKLVEIDKITDPVEKTKRQDEINKLAKQAKKEIQDAQSQDAITSAVEKFKKKVELIDKINKARKDKLDEIKKKFDDGIITKEEKDTYDNQVNKLADDAISQIANPSTQTQGSQKPSLDDIANTAIENIQKINPQPTKPAIIERFVDENGNIVDNKDTKIDKPETGYVRVIFRKGNNGILTSASDKSSDNIGAIVYDIKKNSKASETVLKYQPNVIANAGYEFTGWNPKLPSETDTVTKDEVYTAQYKAKPKPNTPEVTPIQPKPEPKPETKVITHNPNWQQDLKKHNEYVSKHNQKTNKTLPNTGHTNNHSILLVSSLLTLIAYKLYKKED